MSKCNVCGQATQDKKIKDYAAILQKPLNKLKLTDKEIGKGYELAKDKDIQNILEKAREEEIAIAEFEKQKSLRDISDNAFAEATRRLLEKTEENEKLKAEKQEQVRKLKEETENLYHKLGKTNVWRAGNDEVCEIAENYFKKKIDEIFPDCAEQAKSPKEEKKEA